MFDEFGAPSLSGDLNAAAAWAVRSVPVGRSARRSDVRAMAMAFVAVCIVAPFSVTGSILAGILIGLAVLLRAAALCDVIANRATCAPHGSMDLPRVSILLPLRSEMPVVAGLVASIARLNYPAAQLEVIALVEEDDLPTLSALRQCAPTSWRIVAVPAGRPRNKPRACNVGLHIATGDVIVVFDGEDRPEPDQARKAVAALAADDGLAVVQARLGCDHAGRAAAPLSRFWALEYAVLFVTIQPTLARLGLPFLLGGTSNWFRASALREVGGWDAHNVTEDADVGIRLARAGWRSTVIDSTTWEEAPVHFRQWLGQRSRWLKGFAVTTAVHFGRPRQLARDLGPRATLAVVAQLPATLICIAAHPVGLWLTLTGRIDGVIAALALAGYAVTVALHVEVAHRQRLPLWIAALIPFYWLLQALALGLALLDLVRDPSHWRKTEHGLAARPARGLPVGAIARSAGRRLRPQTHLLDRVTRDRRRKP